MNELLNQSAHEMAVIVEKAREYINDAKADNTKRAYRSDWQDFKQWCDSNGSHPLPAEPATVCLYLTQLVVSRKVSTLQRRIAAIGQAHLAAGHSSPTTHISVRSLMRGIRRQIGSIQVGKAPLLIEHIRRMVSSLLESSISVLQSFMKPQAQSFLKAVARSLGISTSSSPSICIAKNLL